MHQRPPAGGDSTPPAAGHGDSGSRTVGTTGPTDELRGKPKREPEPDPELLADLEAIARRCARLLGPGPSSQEIGNFLYDERGLPK